MAGEAPGPRREPQEGTYHLNHKGGAGSPVLTDDERCSIDLQRAQLMPMLAPLVDTLPPPPRFRGIKPTVWYSAHGDVPGTHRRIYKR